MKENSSKTVILVQAPADIPFALDIISKEALSDIYVYAINVENSYTLLKALLNNKIFIEYIPYPFVGYTSIKKIRRARREFKLAWNKYFETRDFHGAVVYFFSRFEDSFTSFLIEQFYRRKQTDFFYINHYDPKDLTIHAKDIIRSLILNPILFYITRGSFRITYRGKFPELNTHHYKVNERTTSIEHVNLTPFLFSIGRKPAVLFLVNPRYDGCCYDYDDFVKTIRSISERLKSKGVTIYIKGHPRMGLPKELEGFYDERIENYVISELIDYSNFSLIIGCESTAIAHAALIKENGVVSILPMLKVVNKVSYEMILKHICSQSDNKVVLATNEDDILAIYDRCSNQ